MVALVLMLAGCGGDERVPDALGHAQDLAAHSRTQAVFASIDAESALQRALAAGPAERSLRRKALAVDPAGTVPDSVNQLLDFGERSFPSYFPTHEANQTAGNLVFRFYPSTGVLLMVADATQVYVLGGPFGAKAINVGPLESFLRPLTGTVSGLSANGLVIGHLGERLSVPAGATAFRFSTLVPSGSTYRIEVLSQPPGLTCSLVNGSGTVDSAVPAVSCPTSVDPLEPRTTVSIGSAASVWGIEPDTTAPGGGGGDGGDGGVGGAAGDGAALVRARVTLTDAAGLVVNGLTDSNGRFLLRFDTARFKAPYVLRVVDGTGHVRTSVITDTIRSNTAAWANINPLTDKIVSDALHPTVGGTDKMFDGSRLDVARLTKARADLIASVRTALTTTGVGNSSRFDPVLSAYRYDGTGVDAVLESLNHTRAPGTGATELRSKLSTIANDAGGTELPRLVTAASPLPGALVSLPGADSLTYAKLQRWIDEFNRCLALTGAVYTADVNCADADGSRLVRPDYKSNSKGFREDLRTLFSEFDGSHVSGSRLANPSILFVDRSPGSTVDDLAVVQFTVVQPYVGPKGPNGPVGGAVEYPVVTVFKRDNTLTRARSGNWILYGNQRSYDLTIEPRYYRFSQGNPAMQDRAPSYMSSSLRMLVLTRRFDTATRRYVDAGIRAVRVRGPGLPAPGVVLAPSTACGASTYLAILNKTGSVPTSDTSSPIVQNDFRLAAARLNGQRFSTPGTYFPTRDSVIHAIPYLSDFSPIRAYSAYTFEVFLRGNPSNTRADHVETARILAPLVPPELALNLPLNSVAPSLPLVSFGAPAVAAGSAVAINWTNNPLASPVGSASVYAEERDAALPVTNFFIIRSQVAGAYSTGSVPSAQLVTVPSVATEPNCAGGRLPAYDGVAGVYREVTLSTLQGQARVFSSLGWNR